MPVWIRPYTASDWDSVCLVYNLAKPDELRGSVDAGTILPLEADTNMKELFRGSEIHVGESSGVVVGFVGTRANSITWLFVHPIHRRQGTAEQLLRFVVSRLHGAITLTVAKSNQAAFLLYEKLGFAVERGLAGHFNGHPVQVLKLRYERVA